MKSGAAFIVFCLTQAACASGLFPRAQNITWKSTNFKTLLSWEPKPSQEYSYTVEYSQQAGNVQRNRLCIKTSQTVCDLSASLSDIKASYTADILSVPPLGGTSDLLEFPHSSSPKFCPYTDTDIGRPNFKLEVGRDQRKVTLYVSDPLTALFDGQRQLSIRDVFREELKYKVTYSKAGSTGKKENVSGSSVVALAGLDAGGSYCFSVQAFIPSRRPEKQLGEHSSIQCSHNDDPSIFEVYSVTVIACAIFLILLLIGIIIAVTVICCRRRRKAGKSGKEGVQLHGV
ncbi:coagulation factor III, tissue factor a [Genypterus blacodes]|uniref:coagulation factor III, tissue factor a n=1 Tax=Genypterus blacodes TaxID=154954 RepID=UPI003F75DB04